MYWSDTYASAPLYRGKLGELYFPMELEGKKVQTTISPSDRFTTLTTDVTRLFYGFDESSPGVEAEREADDVTYHYRAMQLTAPGLTVSNAKIRLRKPQKGCQLELPARRTSGAGYECMGAHPMKLGRNVLQKLRLYFATKEKRLYFTSAEAGRT